MSIPVRPTSPRPSRSSLAPAALLTLVLGVLLLATPGVARAADEAPPGKAWVRAGHFVPGMGQVTVELRPQDTSQETVPMGDAGYADVSSYDAVAPGAYTATVREPSGAGAAEPLLSRSFEVGAGEARTVAVVGTLESPRLVLLDDDLTTPEPGTARVRLLSASEGAGSVTVQAVDGPTIAEDAVLGQATPYVTVPEGAWTLELEGSDSGATSAEVPVSAGSVYTVVVTDTGDGAVGLDVVTDAAGAVVAPRGGAETGGGGTARDATDGRTDGPGAPLLGAAVVLGGAALLTAAAARRRVAR